MKKTILKTVKISGVTSLVLLSGLLFFVFFTGPALPEGSEEMIDQVIMAELPEYVKGESGYVVSGGYRIWYESVLPQGKPKGAVLLFMGMGADALVWPQPFIDQLAKAGYHVVRFDTRGTGMSDWIKEWEKNPYTLSDIADDALAILDHLKIKRAHLVGVSMGGMVAQEFAITHHERALSLTSLMSSGDVFDAELPPVSKVLGFALLRNSLRYGIISSEKSMIKFMLMLWLTLRGETQHEIDSREVAEQVLYNLRRRGGYNTDATAQHLAAITLSASRTERLKSLQLPALIIHGKNDPLIPIEHSQKLAALIPGAKSKWYENMGHDLPLDLVAPITEEILLHLSASSKR